MALSVLAKELPALGAGQHSSPAPISHASQCDAQDKWDLRQWVEAKRGKDYATADRLRA